MMKKSYRFLRTCLPVILLIAYVPDTNGQVLKRLKKSAERAAERAVERRVDRETTEKTDEVLDSILEPGSKGNNPTDTSGNPIPNDGGPNDNNQNGASQGVGGGPAAGEGNSEPIRVYSKFDYVPGTNCSSSMTFPMII